MTLKLRMALGWIILLSLLMQPAGSAGLISLQSPEGQALFQQSEEKTAFWSLLRFFETQQTLSFCGVASAVAVLNALAVPAPIAKDMGDKRLFTQSNFFSAEISSIRTEDRVRRFGYPMAQLAAALRQAGVEVRVEPVTPQSQIDKVRADLRQALAQADSAIIVNFQRRALGQTGGGHFSPLAAYESESDRFLVMDVNRLAYPPTWVTTADLFDAMKTLDGETATYRGYLIVNHAN